MTSGKCESCGHVHDGRCTEQITDRFGTYTCDCPQSYIRRIPEPDTRVMREGAGLDCSALNSMSSAGNAGTEKARALERKNLILQMYRDGQEPTQIRIRLMSQGYFAGVDQRRALACVWSVINRAKKSHPELLLQRKPVSRVDLMLDLLESMRKQRRCSL